MYFVAFLRFCSFLSMKSVVSSANVSARDSLDAYVIPEMFLVEVILMRRISTININRYGDITSPWGTPCSSFKLSVRWPPVSICASLSLRKVLIHVTMSGPKPSAVSVLCMNVCDIESNAKINEQYKSRFFAFDGVLDKIDEINDATADIVMLYVCLLLSSDD